METIISAIGLLVLSVIVGCSSYIICDCVVKFFIKIIKFSKVKIWYLWKVYMKC